MPLRQSGIMHERGDLEGHLKEQIRRVFSTLDQNIGEMAKARGLPPTQVKLLQPVHCCVLVGDVEVFVVSAVHEVGAMAIRSFLDWSGKNMSVPEAVFLAERDLSFQNAFGFKFPRSIMDLDADPKEEAVAQIAERYIEDEVANFEKQQRIVKINPIFQGRGVSFRSAASVRLVAFSGAIQHDL